jgi:hypothetical protein
MENDRKVIAPVQLIPEHVEGFEPKRAKKNNPCPRNQRVLTPLLPVRSLDVDYLNTMQG